MEGGGGGGKEGQADGAEETGDEGEEEGKEEGEDEGDYSGRKQKAGELGGVGWERANSRLEGIPEGRRHVNQRVHISLGSSSSCLQGHVCYCMSIPDAAIPAF